MLRRLLLMVMLVSAGGLARPWADQRHGHACQRERHQQQGRAQAPEQDAESNRWHLTHAAKLRYFRRLAKWVNQHVR